MKRLIIININTSILRNIFGFFFTFISVLLAVLSFCATVRLCLQSYNVQTLHRFTTCRLIVFRYNDI